MNELRYSKKLDFYFYKKERGLFYFTRKRVENNTLNMDVKYLTDMKVFIELIRTLDNYDKWLNSKTQFILSEREGNLLFVKNYFKGNGSEHKPAKIKKIVEKKKVVRKKKYEDFQFCNKESQLFYHTKKRVVNNTLKLDEKYLTDKKTFIELIRTLENYDEWLNSCGSYILESCNDELLFCLRSSKPCAKINRYTKKVTYFTSISELSEDVGYSKPIVNKTMNTLNHRDGFYYCHADKVEEILQQL